MEGHFAYDFVPVFLAEACDRPCLYCQIKGEALADLSNGNPVSSSTSDSACMPEEAEECADDDAMVELKFVPDDPR